MTIRLPPRACPACQRKLDAASDPQQWDDPVEPNAGDITMCLYCGVALVFTSGLGLAEATLKDLMDLEPAQRVALSQLQAARRAMP